MGERVWCPHVQGTRSSQLCSRSSQFEFVPSVVKETEVRAKHIPVDFQTAVSFLH